MKVVREPTLKEPCPTCGATAGQKCELGTGQPRTYVHKDRPIPTAKVFGTRSIK